MANYDLLNQDLPEFVYEMKVSDLKKLIIECLSEMRGSCPASTNSQNKQIKGDEIGY